jgi:peptidoglycan/xylan/chitin deacetylase (PgdA/CDA1 family)
MSRFRIDRNLTLGLVQPALRLFGGTQRWSVPVVMYHGITNRTGVTHPYLETNTSPISFARQMQLLSDLGYRSVDLATAVRMTNSEAGQEKVVVITFDDGLRDFYTHAMQILQDHKFSATMFVVSDSVESRLAHSNGKEFMTWSEVREVESLGISIGSHTVSHPRLHALDSREIIRELVDSKKTIEDELGKRINSFSYPYAFPEQDTAFVEQVRTFLVRAGYRYGVTTVLGSVNRMSDPCFLPRLPINEYDDDKLLRAKLGGAYGWLHAPQLISKYLRGTKTINTRFSDPQHRDHRGEAKR